MKEEFIQFETAVLAKEKGFDWECSQKMYNINGDYCLAPAQSILQKWLRETHEIDVLVYKWGKEYNYDVYKSNIKIMSSTSFKRITTNFKSFFDKYEEALEAALLEGLKLVNLTITDEIRKINGWY